MSRRRSTQASASNSDVTGPTSALTSFLREKGISVPRGNRFQRRQDAAPASDDADPNANAAIPLPDINAPPTPPVAGPGPSSSASRKRKIAEDDDEVTQASTSKSARETAQAKKKAKQQASIDAELAELATTYNPPKGRYADRTPGAFVYCEDCGIKFTLTRYTPSSTDGKGVLCTQCQEENSVPDQKTAEDGAAAKKKSRAVKPKATPVEKPAKLVKSLQDSCIGLIGQHIDSVEDLGDVGSNRDKICRIVCKNRGLTNETIKLFLDLHAEQLTLYDCAQLETDAYEHITSFAPRLKHLTLNFCGGINDGALDILGKKLKHLVRIEMYGPYLIRVAQWDKFMDQFLSGDRPPLSGFLIRQSPRFSNSCLTKLVENFPNLTELRLSEIQKLDNSSLELLHSLKNLTHLDLFRAGLTGENLTDEGVVPLIKAVGAKLETLILSGNEMLGDESLKAVRSCALLRTLGIAGLDITPAGTIELFENWSENDGLENLDMAGCVELDDATLESVVKHSGKMLKEWNLHSVDAKVTEVGLKALAGGCPDLMKLDLGFIRALDDFLLKEILDNCPLLEKLSVFGCSRLTDSAPLKHGMRGLHMRVE